MSKTGFFLVETLVYLMVFSLLIMLVLRMSSNTISQMAHSRMYVQNLSMVNAVMQKFIRDITEAPCNKAKWLLIKSDELIWENNDFTVGWMKEKNTLVRRQGKFDKAKNIWGKKTKSLGAKNIHDVQFDVKRKDQHITAVSISLVCKIIDQNKTFKNHALLENRILP